MRHYLLNALILALFTLALTAVVPSTVRAQDRSDDHHDQMAPDHGDSHAVARPEEHHDDAKADPVAQYRHDHPHASARCHDGFFTTTSDRSRACTKHGGIDVWLVL
ncbi:MAG TPA: hypothetical protein VHN17_06200 [Steroidobacteraceae bacterium]|nr:hypothetical protein [Steroidobacteraceae bacterium]